MNAGTPESRSAGERRLAAILISDVAGYSARMQRDEMGTMALVRTDFVRMEELAAKQGGEVLNTMGDGMLLAFGSAVQAVTFALQVQAEFAHRRALNPPEQSLEHRIGIHVGEVFRRDGKVAGDGVNIAARLQTKAPVGGIAVSQAVYDLIKGKVTVQAVPLGPQEFKNIAEKISVFHLVLPGAAAPAGAATPSAAAGRSGGKLAWAAAFVVLLIGGAGWFWTHRSAAPAPVAAEAPETSAKSIAVLPFTNMSDDKGNAFFADGVHEDILTNLANIRDLGVVSRTSVMEYRDTTKKIQVIARELGVAYVLEGSVRRVGNKVRLVCQLIDGRTGQHLWAPPPYDRNLEDIFSIQSELAQSIATQLRAVLSPQEKARLDRAPTTNTAAYDLYLKAREILNRGRDLEILNRAESLLESAVELDPKFAAAWGQLASIQLSINFRAFDPTGIHMEKARAAIETMERLAPDEPDTWIRLSEYYVDRNDYARVDEYVRRAVQALPSNGQMVMLQADGDKRHGRLAAAEAHYRKACELDRQNPTIRSRLLGWLTATRRYDEAAAFARQDQTDDGLNLAWLAFYSRGSTGEMEAWLKAHPSASAEMVSKWRFATGDAAEVIRLVDETRRNAPSGYLYSYWEARYGMALFGLGQTEKARAVWTENLARLKTSRQDHEVGLAVMHAFLGEKEAAMAALDEIQAQQDKRGVLRDFVGESLVKLTILVWSHQRDEALAELIRLLKIPNGLNVHELRHSLYYKPLQGDPAFEAILDDPKNNAPLL